MKRLFCLLLINSIIQVVNAANQEKKDIAPAQQAAARVFFMDDYNSIALGEKALEHARKDNMNIGIGIRSLDRIDKDSAHNIALGNFSGSFLRKGSGNLYISNSGSEKEERTIRIGEPEKFEGRYVNPNAYHKRTFISGIYGVAPEQGVKAFPVYVTEEGQLVTNVQE